MNINHTPTIPNSKSKQIIPINHKNGKWKTLANYKLHNDSYINSIL